MVKPHFDSHELSFARSGFARKRYDKLYDFGMSRHDETATPAILDAVPNWQNQGEKNEKI